MRRRKRFLIVLRVRNNEDPTGAKYQIIQMARVYTINRKFTVQDAWETLWEEMYRHPEKPLPRDNNALVELWSVTPLLGR